MSTIASTTPRSTSTSALPTLTSATSYNEFESPFRADLTTQFSPLRRSVFGPNEFLQEQTTAYDKFTQELRLASPSSDRFEWLVGAYYTKEKGDILHTSVAVAPGTTKPIPRQPCLEIVTPAFAVRGDRRIPERHDPFRRQLRPDAGRPLQRERPGSQSRTRWGCWRAAHG